MSRAPDLSSAEAALEQDIAACRRLAGTGDETRTPQLPAELARVRASVDAAVAADRGALGTLRSLQRWQRAAAMLFVVVALTAAVVLITPRSDLAVYPTGHMAIVLGLLAVLVVLAGWWLWRPLQLPPPARGARWLVLAVAVAAPAAALLVPLGHSGARAGLGAAFVVGCLKCLAFGAVLGVPIGLLTLAVRRSPVGGRLAAALAGVAAGLTGNLCLQVHCPITDPAHLLCGHAPLLVTLAALAALIGRGALGPRG